MPTEVLVAAVCLGAGVLTGLTGFGFSVFAVPLLLPLLPPQEAVLVVLVLVPLTSAVLLAARDLRRAVDLPTALSLAVLWLFGLPLGLLLMAAVDPLWVTGLIGLVLTLYAGWRLTGTGRAVMGQAWQVPCGLLGGILTTSTGLNGPAMAMYVSGRRLSAHRQVATMACCDDGLLCRGDQRP